MPQHQHSPRFDTYVAPAPWPSTLTRVPRMAVTPCPVRASLLGPANTGSCRTHAKADAMAALAVAARPTAKRSGLVTAFLPNLPVAGWWFMAGNARPASDATYLSGYVEDCNHPQQPHSQPRHGHEHTQQRCGRQYRVVGAASAAEVEGITEDVGCLTQFVNLCESTAVVLLYGQRHHTIV